MNAIERIAQSLRRNPEGLLLLGAGVALLMRNKTAKTAQKRRHRGKAGAGDESDGGATANRFTDAAGDLRERMDSVTETIGSKASELGKAASEIGQAASDRSRRAVRTAQKSVGDMVETHPMAVALGGLATGSLIAALFPSTEIEKTTLAPLGRMAEDAAYDVAAEAKRRVAGAAARTGEQLATAVASRLLEVGADNGNPSAAHEFKSS